MSPPRTLAAAGVAPLSTGTWHTLPLDFGADRSEVADGRGRFAGRDETFPDAGPAGIRPTADSVTEFDQLQEEEAR